MEAHRSGMNTKKKTTSNDPIGQANLILRLYELRRETVMREARSYVGGKFMPHSADELMALVTAGNRETGFILQVYGYWDMVAAFVPSGALEEELVYSTCQEMYFQYAKIQPYLAEFRKKMDMPEFLISIERLVEGSEAGRGRLESMRRNLQALENIRG